MNEPVYEYCDHGTTQRSREPLFADFNVGDLVTWTGDDDIGIILDIYDVDDGPENFYISWTVDTRASGWHGPHPCLKLLSSHESVLTI